MPVAKLGQHEVWNDSASLFVRESSKKLVIVSKTFLTSKLYNIEKTSNVKNISKAIFFIFHIFVYFIGQLFINNKKEVVNLILNAIKNFPEMFQLSKLPLLCQVTRGQLSVWYISMGSPCSSVMWSIIKC